MNYVTSQVPRNPGRWITLFLLHSYPKVLCFKIHHHHHPSLFPIRYIFLCRSWLRLGSFCYVAFWFSSKAMAENQQQHRRCWHICAENAAMPLWSNLNLAGSNIMATLIMSTCFWVVAEGNAFVFSGNLLYEKREVERVNFFHNLYCSLVQWFLLDVK